MRIAPSLAAGLLAATVWLATPAWALPTVDAVQAEVSRGNYSQAETMMAEVVAAKPGSARAQYLYAEILAHNQRFAPAVAALARAKAIDPASKFSTPEKVRAFETLLEREQAAERRPRAAAPEAVAVQAPQQRAEMRMAEPAPAPGVPGWAWALGGGAAALLVWRLVGARRTPAQPAGMGQPGMVATGTAMPAGNGFGGLAVPPQGQGYGAPQAPGGWAAPGARSGMLGTGLAVAGGVAAGMLAERLFEGHNAGAAGQGLAGAGARNDGGLGSGIAPDQGGDASAARDLQQRDIDFGNGDGWGGDDAAASDGSSDGGW